MATAGLLIGCPAKPPTAPGCGQRCDPGDPLDAGASDAALLDATHVDAHAEDAGSAAEDAGTDAGNPDEPAAPIFILQLSDMHIGSQNFALLAFVAALGEVLPVIQPAITVATGDLVDHGEVADQWLAYRSALDSAGLNAQRFVDIPGNHDAKGDAELAGFLTHSLAGNAGCGMYGYRDLLHDGRRLRLVCTNTASGGNYTRNLTGYLDEEQADALIAALDADPLVPDVSVVLGHHPMNGPNSLALFNTDGQLRRLLARTDACAYLFGHVHAAALDWEGRCLLGQAATLGNPSRFNNTPGYSLFAHDDGPTLRHIAMADQDDSPVVDWPVVVITRPAHATLGDFNPFATALPRASEDQLLRAGVFAPATPDEVSFRVDAGNWQPMQIASWGGYQARFRTPDASSCAIEVQVRAVGHTRSDQIELRLN